MSIADSEQTTNGQTPSEEAGGQIASGNETAREEMGGLGEQEEPTSQSERSRMGRRLAEIEREFSSQRDTLSRIEQLLYERERAYAPPQQHEQEDPDGILTRAEYRKIREQEVVQEREGRRRYEMGYIAGIKKQYNSRDAVLYAEIENELLTNVREYPSHSNFRDPMYDAAVNYKLAKANVLERKFVEPPVKPNVRGGTNPPTGFTSSTTTEPPKKAAPKLDEFAEKFARATGLDDEFIRGSLKE